MLPHENLNSIREELDLGEKKKSFVGKVIKIKKKVKRENSNLNINNDINESKSFYSSKICESSRDKSQSSRRIRNDKPNIVKKFFEKNKNKLFRSTYMMNNHFDTKIQQLNKINENQKLDKNRNKLLMKDSLFLNENYFNQENSKNLKNNYKKSNNLFKSQKIIFTKNKIESQLYRLPKEIEKFMCNLDNFYKNYDNMKIFEEKKALEKVNCIKDNIINNFSKLEEKIKMTFKNHQDNLNKEIENLNDKIKNYKKFKKNNWFNNQDTIITIEDLDFFNKINNQKLKNEKYEMNIKAKDYDLFINRRSLVYYKEIIEKNNLHMPGFAIGDCSDLIINDFIKKINNFINEEMEDLFSLIDDPKVVNINDVLVKPSIKLNNKIGFINLNEKRNFELNQLININENWNLGNFEKLNNKHLLIDHNLPKIILFKENKIKTFSSKNELILNSKVLHSLTIKVNKNNKDNFFNQNFYKMMINYDFIHLISTQNGFWGVYIEENNQLKLLKNIIKINKNILYFKLYYDNYNLFMLLEDNSINIMNLNSLKFTYKELINNDIITGFDFSKNNQLIINCKKRFFIYNFYLENYNIFNWIHKNTFNLNFSKILVFNEYFIGLNKIDNLFYYLEESGNKNIIKNLNVNSILDFIIIPNSMGKNNDFMIFFINSKGELFIYNNINQNIFKFKEKLDFIEDLKIELLQIKENHFNLLIKNNYNFRYYKININ